MSRQMMSACATPPAEPTSFHPGMEDIRDGKSSDEKKRDAPESQVGKESSIYTLVSELDGSAPRSSKSPRRDGVLDTSSLISGAASKLSQWTTGQSSASIGSSWAMVEAPPGGLATLGMSPLAGEKLALVTVGKAGVGVNAVPSTDIVTFNMASGEGRSALSAT